MGEMQYFYFNWLITVFKQKSKNKWDDEISVVGGVGERMLASLNRKKSNAKHWQGLHKGAEVAAFVVAE